MNAKHTAGPWHVCAILKNRIVGDETAKEFDKLQINSANRTVATVYRIYDATLIARAPGLLAEVERLRAALEVTRNSLRLFHDLDRQVSPAEILASNSATEAMEIARAALAEKA